MAKWPRSLTSGWSINHDHCNQPSQDRPDVDQGIQESPTPEADPPQEQAEGEGMTATVKQLERAAIAAHKAGSGWEEFWRVYGPQVCDAEPFNRERFRRLTDRLLHLLICGNPNGQYPVGDPDATPPWELADARHTQRGKQHPSFLP